MIVCFNQDGLIGLDGSTPWYLREDLQYFKRRTQGAPVLMGSKTFLGCLRGSRLKSRCNIVLTTDRRRFLGRVLLRAGKLAHNKKEQNCCPERPALRQLAQLEAIFKGTGDVSSVALEEVLYMLHSLCNGLLLCSNIQEVLEELEPFKKAWVIGGASVYAAFMPYVDFLDVTRIKWEVQSLGRKAVCLTKEITSDTLLAESFDRISHRCGVYTDRDGVYVPYEHSLLIRRGANASDVKTAFDL